MKPSNPATYFVTGSDQVEFKYDPGPIPHYAIGRRTGYITFSLLIFAHDDEEHVRQILGEWVEFVKRCADAYYAHVRSLQVEDRHDLAARHQGHAERVRQCVAEEGSHTLYIDRADTDQLYRIGWASNDTV